MFSKLLDVLRGKGINTEGATDMSRRTELNLKALQPLSDQSANDAHIKQMALQDFEDNRQVKVLLREWKQDRDALMTEAKLYLDDWAFHHGGLTNENLKQAITHTINRLSARHRGISILKEEQEFRQMQGPLAEFDDLEPMSDLPDDGDFERELIKRDPSLRQYKK